MKSLTITLLFILTSLCFAGSNDAKITGETSSGRTNFELFVGDLTGDIRTVKLTIDGHSYTFSPDESTVIKDDENNIYILIASNENYHFKMWMIPGSEKVISKSSSSLNTTFAAVIEASDPRKQDKWTSTPRITIGCTLSYSL